MESHGSLGQQLVEGSRTERRLERKRGGGSGGLVVGIATVVVVGVAGKLLQRLNSLNRQSKAVAVAKDSIDKTVASGGQQRPSATVLTKVLSIVRDHEAHDRDSNAISIDASNVKEKYIGCETPVASVKETGRSRSFGADAEIPDQDSLSEDTDSKGAEFQVKHPLDIVVAADHEGEAACQKSETDFAAQTALAELVHKSVKHEITSDENPLSTTKDLQDGIADVISQAFVDFGSGDLSSQEQAAPKKLTVQVLWDDNPEPDEADAADIADSGPGSETPEHYDAEDNSEGFTYHSESDSANVVSEYMDARDTDPAAAGDELEEEFVIQEAQIKDTRMDSEFEVSMPESTNWPQAITFSEFIKSVQASTSTEITDQVTEDVPALAESVAERSSAVHPQSREDLSQADSDYFAREDPSAFHDESEAEYSLGKCETGYEESPEAAESVLGECEACPSFETQEEAENNSREKQIEKVSAERQQAETQGKSLQILKEMEPLVEEKFEESASSLEPETTIIPSAHVDGNNAENGYVDRAMVRPAEEEESVISTSEDKLVEKVTETKEVAVEEINLQNAEVAPRKREGDGANMKAKSSLVLPSKPCNPNNSFKHSRRHNVSGSNSANIAKGATMSTVEFSRPSNNVGTLKQLETSRDRSATEVLRMAIFIALVAAIMFMIREHHLKPLKHAA